MPQLQATWTPEGRLFFWTLDGPLEEAVSREAPEIAELTSVGQTTRRNLAFPGPVRQKLAGFEVPVKAVLPVLAVMKADDDLTDSLRCWNYATKLALELAAAQRVVPNVDKFNGHAFWTALLSREADRSRFEALVQALPTVCRAVPASERGAIRLYTARKVAREFIDKAVDATYRQDAYPGTARGWALEFARALKDDRDTRFRPRDARYQGVPDMLLGWAAEADAGGLRLGVSLVLPDSDQNRTNFSLNYFLHPVGSNSRVSLAEAWKAGKSIKIDGVTYTQPATSAITGMARMARLYDPLNMSLQGKAPRDLKWKAQQAWDFLAHGAPLLVDAGFEVELPPEFQHAGRRRIRARMRVDATGMEEGGALELSSLLRFTWEVVLGDIVLTGAQFTELLAKKQPVVEFEGEWVLLDPAELAKLPAGLPQEGTLPAAVALRAVLTGQHEGVEVVADGRLELILEALRKPPSVPAPASLQGTLRPYQLDGLAWLTTLGQLGLGACLADDMGLGKTIQLISHLLRRQEARALHPNRPARPSLVICPTSVLGNWKRELARFAPSLKVARYHGLQRNPAVFELADVVLTTYGLLVRDREVLAEQAWDIVALDEAQAIKNPDSQRARSARELSAKHRVAMTGTPVENRLDELWSLMQFLVPGLLGPRATFRRNVAVPVERFGDQEIAHSLKLGVSPFLLRRLKTDPSIIDDLPEKLESNDYSALKPEQAALYKEVANTYLESIGGASNIQRRGQVLAMLTALKQVCNHPVHYLKEPNGELSRRSGKLERLTELVDDILELKEAALVFTQYREMGELLQRHFLETFEEEIPFLHGGVPPEHRDAMVDRFQAAEGPPLLIVSLKAGGTGLNLTRASHVIHYDRWWNPAVEDQATDRAYRIGQRKNVQVHKMISQGTLEERIDAMLQEKRALAASVVGTGEAWVTELDDDALRALIMLGDDAVEEDE